MKRALVLGLIGLVILVPSAVFAQDLGGLLEDAQNAEFEGEQVISCITPDGPRDVIVKIQQSDGLVRISPVGGGEAVAGAGATVPDFSNESGEIVGSYEARLKQQTLFLGRAATEYEVFDASGFRRAKMVFDHPTGALMLSEIYNSDGAVYCVTRMIAFSPGASIESSWASTGSPSLVIEESERRFPEAVAGFELRAEFVWEDGGVLGYFSDGLFSFTLLASERPVTLAAGDVSRVQTDAGDYLRWYGAGQVMYVWEASDGGYALLGDLPVDLQQSVLDELPAPWQPSLFRRILRNWFG